MAIFLEKLNFLLALVKERLSVVLEKRDLDELKRSGALIGEFWRANFWSDPQFRIVSGIGGLVLLVLCFIFQSLQTGDIDVALRSEQAAKAEAMIQKRLILLPWHHGLKLRLAHAYLKLGKEEQAIKLIQEVVIKDSHNEYLAVIGMNVAQITQLNGRIEQGIELLEGIPEKSCPKCLKGLSELYTIQGRKALGKRDLRRAYAYLAKALALAEKIQDTNDSIQSRRRELSRVYEYQASLMAEARDYKKAIESLEKANQLFENGLNYLKLGHLYEAIALNSLEQAKKSLKSINPNKKISIENQDSPSVDLIDFRKALDSYIKAYSTGLTEATADFKKLLVRFQEAMKFNGYSEKIIENELKPYTDHEMASTR